MLRSLPILACLSCFACAHATLVRTIPSGSAAADDAVIGTAHPFTVFDYDPHARWVGLCQARADTNGDAVIATSTSPYSQPYPLRDGDNFLPYLVFGSGPGLAIDDYFGQGCDDNCLAFSQDGHLKLHYISEGRRSSSISAVCSTASRSPIAGTG